LKPRNLKETDEATITRAIIEHASKDWLNIAESDVIIVGAGPAGLTAAKYLAKTGLRTVIFERKLSFGGGIGGGGMLFHKLVVQEPADKILREIGCQLQPVKGEKGLYIGEASSMIAKLAVAAIDAGAKIILGVTVDDLIYRQPTTSKAKPEIVGVVIQWSSVIMSGIHVDPLGIKAKAVIDCTGHDAEILTIAARKIPELELLVPGEKAMWASEAEKMTVEKTGEVCPGLYVAGMAVGALHQTPRMGPIFGGMLLSGAKVAQLVARKLLGEKAAEIVPFDFT
jgi:thiamine thiazole synthase